MINHGVYTNEDDFIEVNTITLDDYCKINNIYSCRLLKIDVERAELEVIKGMTHLLATQSIDYIILEQISGSESQNVLESFGYTGWFIDEHKKSLVNIQLLNKQEIFGNFLFVKATYLKEFKNQFANFLKI